MSYSSDEYKLYLDYAAKFGDKSDTEAIAIADKMKKSELKAVIKVAKSLYNYPEEGKESLISDEVYDYLEKIFERKRTKITIKRTKRPTRIKPKMTSESALTHLPEEMSSEIKLVRSPYWLGSMNKMTHGDGALSLWTAKFTGSYTISSKMDGMSILTYTHKGKRMLISRGKRQDECQDISNMLKFINIPDSLADLSLPPMRGELIMRNSIFNEKYKKSDRDDTRANRFKNGRNAVAGISRHFATNRLSDLKASYVEIARDIEIVFYELIESPQRKASDQLKFLEELGLTVPRHEVSATISDDMLSAKLDTYMLDDYDIDGLVVYSDHSYPRNTSGNPEYARAYKKPLDSLIGQTKVIKVVWEGDRGASRHGRLKPVVSIEPIDLDGVTISNATGHNAKFVIEHKLGPGAVVKVLRSGGVIPKIIEVVEPVAEVEMPSVPYKWDCTETELLYDSDGETESEHGLSETAIKILVNKMHFFLTTINAKGIGKSTVRKLYDHAGIKSVLDLVTLILPGGEERISFLGKKSPANIVKAIKGSLEEAPLSVILAGSGVFKSGVGVKIFHAILLKYPDFLDLADLKSEAEMIELLREVEGIATTTAKLISQDMSKFLKFFYTFPREVVSNVLVNTQAMLDAEADTASDSGGDSMKGIRAYLTGGSNKEIESYIIRNGGEVKGWSEKLTNMVIIKNDSISNKKTATAAASSGRIEMLTWDQFLEKYM